MRLLRLKADMTLWPADERYLGGALRVSEQRAMGGVSSPKMIYRRGIPEFDKMRAEIPSEVPFLHLQLFRGGLVLWLQQSRRLVAAGITFDALNQIKLSAYPSGELGRRKFDWRKPFKYEYLTIFKGLLVLHLDEDEFVACEVIPRHFDKTVTFFEKPILADRFVYEEVEPPHNDTSPGTGREPLPDVLDDWLF